MSIRLWDNKPVHIGEYETKFIVQNINEYSINQLSRTLKISPHSMVKAIKKLGLKKRIGRPSHIKDCIGDALEDYFANELSILDICDKYTISKYMFSKYISKMFFVRMTEKTSVIVKQSKINQNL